MPQRGRGFTPGFTLIELLVVIAIVSILTAILFPVFARARENARRTSCLSNLKQVGLGLMQYTQDYDEALPLVSFPTPSNSWTISMQPYLKSQQILRCPSDTSALWGSGTRLTSYGFNAWMKASRDAWMSSEQPYRHLSQLQAPAKIICLSELGDASTQDHFPPYCWGSPAETVACPPGAWNAAASEPNSLNIRRHLEGFNNLYADGHAKWHKWTQLWWQDSTVTPGVLQGNFDPRQQ